MVTHLDTEADRDRLLLPDGETLLHIGLPKTGSTAVQYAASMQREALAALGVRYPGAGRSQQRELLSLLRTERPGAGDTPTVGWDRLRREVVRRRAPRTFVSGESASQATAAMAARLAGELGPARVVVTLRGLQERLLAAWQQRVREGSGGWPLDDWLHIMLGDTQDASIQPWFFERNLDPVGVIERWAHAVGPDRVTVVLVDKRVPQLLFESFERMLGLPDEMLSRFAVTDPTLQANRGLGQTEIEFVRQIRLVLAEHGVPRQRVKHVLAHGGLLRARMRRAAGDDPIRMPRWAAERLAPVARDQRERLEASAVRLIGDSATLENTVPVRDEPYPVLDRVPTDLAVDLVVGTAAKGAGLDPGLRRELDDDEWNEVVRAARTGTDGSDDDE